MGYGCLWKIRTIVRLNLKTHARCSMRNFLLHLACLCCLLPVGNAATSDPSPTSGAHTPGPSYPSDALKANVTGRGLCEVEFDASGHVVHAVMTKSTGSKVLDENTLAYARKNWTGKPNSHVSVPITYQLAPPAKTLKDAPHVHVPFPPYPYQARAKNLQGSGVAKVSFDEKGKAISVTMAKSTGSDILDKNTIYFGLANWKSYEKKKLTIFVPVTYQLR